MADVINLRQARKEKARRDKKAKAAEQRALSGRTKTEKLHDRLEADQARRHLDGHKRESDEP